MLSRNEQESLVVQFEREYGELVMSSNCGQLNINRFYFLTFKLSNDIRTIAKKNYFEEDLIQFLNNLAESIENKTHLCRSKKNTIADEPSAIKN